MDKCSAQDCTENVTKEGHKLCYRHWKASKSGTLKECDKCGRLFEGVEPSCASCRKSVPSSAPPKLSDEFLSSTRIGEHFGIPSTRTNLVFAELGWIEKFVKGWKITEQGKKQGGVQREVRQSGIPFVVWPASILTNVVLVNTIRESQGGDERPAPGVPSSSSAPTPPVQETGSNIQSSHEDFRSRFPASQRTTDGHLVRSRAEMLIDNWLYMQQIIHAVERKLPIEEDVYCDFYLPTGKVYIEYWGMEKDPRYAARMQEKKAIYQRYNLNLVELTDNDIMNLDDVLPRLLIKYNIDCT